MIEDQPQNQEQDPLKSSIGADSSEFEYVAPDIRTDLLLRLFASSEDRVSDLELLALILASTKTQNDPHALAMRLLERFGDVNRIMFADVHLLKQIDGVDKPTLQILGLMKLMALRMTRTTLIEQNSITSWQNLMEYCKLKIGHGNVEEFHVLFLNHAHVLISDEVMQRGTINHTPVYVREIIKRALELSASALILLHNHPSGDPTPSKADIDITKKIIEAAAAIGSTVHDHVIITPSGHYSFKSFGLI